MDSRRRSGAAVNLGPPPSHADEQESPVLEELRRLPLKGMTDELKDPSGDEQNQRVPPQPVAQKSGGEEREREKNEWDTVGMAKPVDGMLVASGIFRDPLLAANSTKHSAGDHTTSGVYFVPDARCR